MNLFLELFGEGNDLTILQMCVRTVITFIIAIFLTRISGRRSFSLHTAFDNVITLLLGAILARAIVGASPYLPTILACLVLSILHRLFALLGIHYPYIENLIKGKKIPLYKEGVFIQKNLARSLVSKEDIMEAIRLTSHVNSLENVKEIYMERNGKITSLMSEKKN